MRRCHAHYHHPSWILRHPIFIFLYCHNTDTKSKLHNLVPLRNLETLDEMWCADLVLMVGPAVVPHMKDAVSACYPMAIPQDYHRLQNSPR